jgi:VIT1/CCC1 family predicted Fe2+/Mn2+ transporter
MNESSLLGRLRASLAASAGDVVFGMEDGTVSIFGLVFGVAATTNHSSTVLIAGATGAVAAAVSMMAGAYLDAETSRDEAQSSAALIDLQMQRDSAEVLESVMDSIRAVGIGHDQAKTLTSFLRTEPAILKGVASALTASAVPGLTQSPLVHSLWMLVADFLAAAIPIVPFALMPVPAGRVVSGAVTLLLLIGLGIGRARIAGRSILRTVIETVSIGVAAALAGVAIGVGMARIFGA